jgi:glyoxylate carboligase
MRAWMERVDNRKAIERLAQAARIVIAKYDGVIPADFLNAMRSQFAEQIVDSEQPCTCFMWHKSPATWTYRFHKLGLSKPPVR